MTAQAIETDLSSMWAHIDIAGTAQSDAASGWTNKGATGFGTRLLIDFCLGFTVPPALEARP